MSPSYIRPIIYIGPDKAASTWFFELLRNHPEVGSSGSKELFFFDRNYHLGEEWYGRQFGGTTGAMSRILDVSHDYLFHPLAPRRIAGFSAETTLVVGMRSPIDRAISAYRYMQYQGRLSGGTSFEQALSGCAELVEHGLYGRNLQAWFDVFPPSRVVPLWFSDLKSDPHRAAEGLKTALDLDAPVTLPARSRNARPTRRLPAGLVAPMRNALDGLRRRGQVQVAARLKMAGRAVAVGRPMPAGKVGLSPSTDEQLRELFWKDLERLDAITGWQARTRWAELAPPTGRTRAVAANSDRR